MLPWRIISSSRQRSLASLRLPWQLEQPLKSASSKELPVAAMPTHYRGCGRSSFCREFSSSNALETRINIGAGVSPLDKMDYFVERLPGPARGREFTTCDDPGTT
jgi:hypothetical protein